MGPSRSFTGRFVDCVAVDVGCLIVGIMRVRTVACEEIGAESAAVCVVVGIVCSCMALHGFTVVCVIVGVMHAYAVVCVVVVVVGVVRSSVVVCLVQVSIVCVCNVWVCVVFCVCEVLDLVCDFCVFVVCVLVLVCV